MREFIKGFLDGPRYVGAFILKGIRYFGIGCYTIITSRILLALLVICLGLGIFQVSTGFREEVVNKEQEMFFNTREDNVDYYYEEVNFNNYSNGMAIDELVNCYSSSIKLEEIPDNIKDYIDKLETLYDKDSRNFSFVYQDLFSGFTVSYNIDGAIFTASTIKAPAMIYIYELASRGEIDLNEKLVYTSNYYHGGSGVLRNKKFNTEYTIEELLQYTIYESDNIAYNMLISRFGKDNIRDFWRRLGTKNIFENNTIWGYMSANDARIYMKELYRFSKDNEEYGVRLLEHFKKAKWKMITNKDMEYNTANKGGWSGKAIHDVAIVFEENPYILVITSNLGEGGYHNLFKETSRLVGEMHDNYWRYKVDVCSNIKLY